MLSSCECKEVEPDNTTRTQGKMSVRVLDKNSDAIVPFSPYKPADFCVTWTNGGNYGQDVGIDAGYFDNPMINPISKGVYVSFMRDMNAPTSCYQPTANQDYQVTKFFDVVGFGTDSRSVLLDPININENLTLTKDDADSLVGNFRVRLKTIAPNSVDTITVEGRFSCAKRGLFINPLKK